MSQPTRQVITCTEFGEIGPVVENPWIFGTTGPISPNGRRSNLFFVTFYRFVFFYYPLGQQMACDQTSICSIRLFAITED